LGEYSAACVAGVFSVEDGLRLTAARGRLMLERTERGSMVALLAPAIEVRDAIAPYDRVSIAAENGPNNVVISGDKLQVRMVAARMMERGFESRDLEVSHAFHSPLMDPMLSAFGEVAAKVAYREPKMRVVSNVSGEVAARELCDAAYWVHHVRATVKYGAAVERVAASATRHFIEVGPGAGLLSAGRRVVDDGRWFPTMRRGEEQWPLLLETLGELHLDGVNIVWSAFDADRRRRKVPLPTYPFLRERYWLVAEESSAPRPDIRKERDPVADLVLERVSLLGSIPVALLDLGQRLVDLDFDEAMTLELSEALGVPHDLVTSAPLADIVAFVASRREEPKVELVFERARGTIAAWETKPSTAAHRCVARMQHLDNDTFVAEITAIRASEPLFHLLEAACHVVGIRPPVVFSEVHASGIDQVSSERPTFLVGTLRDKVYVDGALSRARAAMSVVQSGSPVGEMMVSVIKDDQAFAQLPTRV
jgi:acyl transferase domain-containing protein